ncbi:hypothetical protein H920_13588 [Fukomys damarensis]|uniref:Uncharacterized protein n=1 Tax=Fukomys damarensis TaxID=885580 RepID=A0A091D1Y6_FUKDA|nr:hypothetical protein H920_13588 [Fukomys damarensis]
MARRIEESNSQAKCVNQVTLRHLRNPRHEEGQKIEKNRPGETGYFEQIKDAEDRSKPETEMIENYPVNAVDQYYKSIAQTPKYTLHTYEEGEEVLQAPFHVHTGDSESNITDL